MGLLSVPLKTILPFWQATTDHPLPSEWEFCDGRVLPAGTHKVDGGVNPYTLPDLRGSFLLGADQTKDFEEAATSGDTAGDAPGPGGTGGNATHTLTVAELPSHTHTVTVSSAGEHRHPVSTSLDGAHNHAVDNYVFDHGEIIGYVQIPNTPGHPVITGSNDETLAAGTHTHTITQSADTSHYNAHDISVGDVPEDYFAQQGTSPLNQPFNIQPAYAGVVYIIKVR